MEPVSGKELTVIDGVEAARRLGVTKWTLKDHREAGRIRSLVGTPVRTGKRGRPSLFWYPVEDIERLALELEAWRARRRKTTTAETLVAQAAA